MIAVALVLAAVAAGPAPSDAAAKSAARNAVSELESCFASTGTYRGCELPDVPGGGLEHVTVARATKRGYAVRVGARSGVTYRIVRSERADHRRFCAPKGRGGCGADGRW